MKIFHIDLVITTTGNHDVESVKQWLTDLLSDAMQSDIERNGIVHMKVSAFTESKDNQMIFDKM